ncbi:GIY-YIG nuclease family protein [Streptomyces reticuli]|uniref:GIY-YIG nuclease family protein n=1 Tax=Streptomyces reticuli TaxID=1926 RepID=UPI00073E04EC|nr:hypothetical protein [Streptomyces sp. SID7810]CUW31744.1 T5orf172 domain protein [Streptomyces reticuli]
MAIEQLARHGWIALKADTSYCVAQPPSKRPGTFYEAVWGDTPPQAITPAAPAPPPNAAVEPPRPTRIRSRKTASTYLIGIDGLPFVKIGRTAADPRARLAGLQTGQPMQLHLLWSCEGDFEAELHIRFDAYHYRGEWFDLSPLGDPVDVMKAAVAEIQAQSR